MINRNHRILACLLLCVMLFSVIVVPISHSKDKEKPSWLMKYWIAFTTALDILEAIRISIAVITEDLEDMQDALAKANDELNDVLYPERERREEEIGKLQAKLDELNAEREAALEKRSNAKSRISSLKSEIQQAEADLAKLSPYEEEARKALELHISMLKSSLKSAEQDVKDANKIIHSNWRALKRSSYETSISVLTRALILQVTSRISRLENLTDLLRPKIEEKAGELKTEEERRKAQQAEVDAKRAEYEKKEKEANSNDQR